MSSTGFIVGQGQAWGQGQSVSASTGTASGAATVVGSQPPPFLVNQVGSFGVYADIETVQRGHFRIANSPGYSVYVQGGAPPTFNRDPDYFSTTLPITVPLTPPGSGTLTYFTLIRSRNQYGLESANQYCSQTVINSTGDQVLPPISTPQNLELYEQAGGVLRILASYPGALSDPSPADKWKVWVGLTPPDPTIDPPFLIKAVSGSSLAVSQGVLSPGLYSVTVGLYRSSDGQLSIVLTGSVTISSTPVEPEAVHSGFDQP